MKIIALPDIHARTNPVKAIARELAEVDVVLLVGDLSNGRMEEALRVFNSLEKYNENLLVVPGNMDTDQLIAYTSREGINLHRRHCVIDGVAFVGLGGALPFAGSLEFTEAQLAEFLEEAADGLNPDLPQILISHQPPLNTLNDRLSSGQHVGSQSVRSYIEQHQPLICFTGHVHEGRGIDRIGATQVVNPGPFWPRSDWGNGHYAFAELEQGSIRLLEIRAITE